MPERRKHIILRSESGMALVLTLMIVALIVALVTEFAYDVFTATSALNNWKESQRLSLVAKSGVMLAVKTVSRIPNTPEMYKYLGKEFPVENILEGFEGTVVVKVEDENAKFNLNSLNTPAIGVATGQMLAYASFKRLLKNLGIEDQTIADKVAAWTMKGNVQNSAGEAVKNGFMDSVDELLLIKGIDAQTYGKLFPYVTVYGATDSSGVGGPGTDLVNINTAPLPVIMSLADNISSQDAQSVIRQREIEPFTDATTIDKYAGLGGTWPRLVVRPSNLHITVTVEENRIKRIIECVVATGQGGSGTILYWKEI